MTSRENENPIARPVGRSWATSGRGAQIRRIAQWVVVALIAVGFASAIWKEWPKIQAHQWQITPGYLILGVVLLLARGPLICVAWRAIVRQMGYPLPLATAVRVYFYSGMAKYLPGNLWYAVGRVLLAEAAGVPKMVTSVSIALETALVTVAAVAVGGGAMVLTIGGGSLWGLLVVLVGLIGFLAWPQPWFRLMNWGLARIGRTPVPLTITGRQLLTLLPLFLLSWIVYGLISFCWTAALDPGLGWDQLPAITGIYTTTWVIGFLTLLAPNGFGVREGLLTLWLQSMLGLPLVVAGGAAILSRLGSILGEAAWAGIAWLLPPPAASRQSSVVSDGVDNSNTPHATRHTP
jgi:hypothetical protein